MQKRLLGCFISLLILVVPSHSQKSRWGNLDQIQAGAKVQVVEQNLKSTTGRFVRFSKDDLRLSVNEQEVVIPRERVYRVSVIGKNRKRNALIGLAAGVGGGAAWAVAMRNTENWRPGDSAGVIGGCAALGAGIGAIAPSARTVYTAERPKQAEAKGNSESPQH